MTIKQLAETYNYSVSSIEKNFVRTAKAIKKKYGVQIVKCNRGNGNQYFIISPRAETIYEQPEEKIHLPFDSIKMDDLLLFVLIGVVRTSHNVFRGTEKQFLDYIDLPKTKRNVDLLNEIFDKYANKQGQPLVVFRHKDKIFISIDSDFEKQQILTLQMLKKCHQIAKKYNKKNMKVVQLLKVWQAYRINEYKGNNVIANKDLQKYIDLSEKQIRDIKKLLQKENIILTKRMGSYDRMIGTDFSVNLFFDKQLEVIKQLKN